MFHLFADQLENNINFGRWTSPIRLHLRYNSIKRPEKNHLSAQL